MSLYRIGGRIYEVLLYLLTLGKEERVKSEAIARLCIRPGDAVLDWGCGTGFSLRYILEALKGRGAVYAVEASPRMLGRAAGRFSPSPECPIHFVLRSGHELHLCECRRFDSVIASYSLSAAAIADYSEVIDEIRRHLKPGGKLLVIDHYVPEAKGWFARFHNRVYIYVGSKVFDVDFSPNLLSTLKEKGETAHLEYYPHMLAYCWMGTLGRGDGETAALAKDVARGLDARGNDRTLPAPAEEREVVPAGEAE